MKRFAIAVSIFALAACSGSREGCADQSAGRAIPGYRNDIYKDRKYRAWQSALPLDDQQDFDDASRGFLAAIDADAITAANGTPVWPNCPV